MSISRYTNLLRLTEAKKLLKNTHISIKQISERTGFSEEDLKAVRMCYKKLFVNKKLTVHEALEELRHSGYAENACLRRIIQFVETSERGFCH